MVDNSDNNAFDRLDADRLRAEIREESVAAAKQSLIESIQGKKEQFSWEEQGKKAPDNYNELFSEVDKRTIRPEQVDEIVERKISEREKQREEASTKREEDSRKKQMEDLESRRKDFDKEWYGLTQEGKMPKVAEQLQERINKGERLTREEIENDEGLSARLKLAQVAQTSGKTTRLAYYEDFSTTPAGAAAPVIGARPTTPKADTGEYSYDDIQRDRKKMFGF